MTLSKCQVLQCVLGNENLRKFNVKFTNKAKPRPVSVNEIHERHQTDLVDMKNMAAKYEGKTCQSILSVMNIFSRFYWLARLTTKKQSCKKVAAKDLQDSWYSKTFAKWQWR